MCGCDQKIAKSTVDAVHRPQKIDETDLNHLSLSQSNTPLLLGAGRRHDHTRHPQHPPPPLSSITPSPPAAAAAAAAARVFLLCRPHPRSPVRAEELQKRIILHKRIGILQVRFTATCVPHAASHHRCRSAAVDYIAVAYSAFAVHHDSSTCFPSQHREEASSQDLQPIPVGSVASP